jgi:hypothetical protein
MKFASKIAIAVAVLATAGWAQAQTSQKSDPSQMTTQPEGSKPGGGAASGSMSKDTGAPSKKASPSTGKAEQNKADPSQMVTQPEGAKAGVTGPSSGSMSKKDTGMTKKESASTGKAQSDKSDPSQMSSSPQGTKPGTTVGSDSMSKDATAKSGSTREGQGAARSLRSVPDDDPAGRGQADQVGTLRRSAFLPGPTGPVFRCSGLPERD